MVERAIPVEIVDDYAAEGHINRMGTRCRRGLEAYSNRMGRDHDGGVYELIMFQFELSDDHAFFNEKDWHFRYDKGIDVSYSELTIPINDYDGVFCEHIPVYAVLPKGSSKVLLVANAWVRRNYKDYLLSNPHEAHMSAGLHTTDIETGATYPIDVRLVFKSFIKAMR